jgi:hypothetical protein
LAKLPSPPSATVQAIYKAYEDRLQERQRRDHLGGSEIGHECDRKLWLGFRWASTSKFPGRVLRLFQTGHLQEDRIVADLRAIGVQVFSTDPETGRQYVVSSSNDHFGGSLDGIGIGIPDDPEKAHVLEFKTHNAKSFAALCAKGVKVSKPIHYTQMQIYMYLAGYDWALYVAVNKNTDALYSERIEINIQHAEVALNRADRIINSPYPPMKISEDPTFYICKFCNVREACHFQRGVPRNCRTCINSTPIEQGLWRCELATECIPREVMLVGCDEHRMIPDLVPGEQVDVKGNDVVYRLKDGTEWVDNGRNASLPATAYAPEESDEYD